MDWRESVERGSLNRHGNDRRNFTNSRSIVPKRAQNAILERLDRKTIESRSATTRLLKVGAPHSPQFTQAPADYVWTLAAVPGLVVGPRRCRNEAGDRSVCVRAAIRSIVDEQRTHSAAVHSERGSKFP